MPMNEKFNQDLKYAETAEHKVWVYFLESDKAKNVLDVRKDKYFQKADVDFLVGLINGTIYKIEVKSDRKAKRTGNIFYEEIDRGKAGCFARTHADYICIYIDGSDEVLAVNMPKLRTSIPELLNKGYISWIDNAGDGSSGYLIPINTILEKGFGNWLGGKQ